MWAGLDQQREQIRRAGLELAPGELLAAATGRGARLEGITAVLLLTDEDDFNALASVLLAETVEGRVYRLAPPQRSHGVVAPYTDRGDPVRQWHDQASGQPSDIRTGRGSPRTAPTACCPPDRTSCSSCARMASSLPSLRLARRRRSLVTPWCLWARCR